MRAASVIREARRRAGLTQSGLAARLGTTDRRRAAGVRRDRAGVRQGVDAVRACGLELTSSLVARDDSDWSVAPQPDAPAGRARQAPPGGAATGARRQGGDARCPMSSDRSDIRGAADPRGPVRPRGRLRRGDPRIALPHDRHRCGARGLAREPRPALGGARRPPRSGLGGPCAGGLPFGHDAASLAAAEMWNLVTDAGRLDITLEPSGTSGYLDVARDAVRLTITGDRGGRRLAGQHDPVEGGGGAGEGSPRPAGVRRILDEQAEPPAECARLGCSAELPAVIVGRPRRRSQGGPEHVAHQSRDRLRGDRVAASLAHRVRGAERVPKADGERHPRTDSISDPSIAKHEAARPGSRSRRTRRFTNVARSTATGFFEIASTRTAMGR